MIFSILNYFTILQITACQLVVKLSNFLTLELKWIWKLLYFCSGHSKWKNRISRSTEI